MTTCQKTIVYAVPHRNNVSENTLTNFDQISIYIPETSPVFKSVFVLVNFKYRLNLSAYDILEHSVGLRLGTAAYTTRTVGVDMADGSNVFQGQLGAYDFTSHFTSNWSGTSKTCDVQFFFNEDNGLNPASSAENMNALIYITYEYNDSPSTNATQIKTVAIPFESIPDTLPTTATTYLTVPILTGGGTPYLPENSVSIRDWFIAWEYNEFPDTNPDYVVTIDRGGSDAITYSMRQITVDATMQLSVYKPSSVPDPTTTHNIRAWVSSGSVSRWLHPAAILYVTYEFNVSASTRMLNSRIIPWSSADALPLNSAVEIADKILVPEPGTITTKNCGIWFRYTPRGDGPFEINIKAGSQSYREYNSTAATSSQANPNKTFLHRVDSGSAAGTGLTLSRGFNTFSAQYYSASSNVPAAICGYFILNYESDIPSPGGTKSFGIASHTVFSAFRFFGSTGSSYPVMAPNANYYLHSLAIVVNFWRYGLTNDPDEQQPSGVMFHVFFTLNSGEGAGSGASVSSGAISDWWGSSVDEHSGGTTVIRNISRIVKATPQDPRTDRFNWAASRSIDFVARASWPTTMLYSAWMIADYSAITYTASGVIEDYAGTGSGIPVSLYSEALDRRVDEVSSTTGGNFSFTWYDNTSGDLWAEAREDNTHVGRSNNSNAN